MSYLYINHQQKSILILNIIIPNLKKLYGCCRADRYSHQE